jgi:cytochrome c biogenesis protein CcmG, thiol:disulfide interchange protein DsbE
VRSICLWSAAVIAGVLILTAMSGTCAHAAVDVGQPAPSLVVEELGGQTFDLAALHGKVVVVSFWATWCPPCQKEMPALNIFYRHYHDRGLDVIGLSADRPRDRSDVIKVMQSFSYPAAMLDDARVNGFGEPSALPTTYVIDARGIVRAKLTPEERAVTEQSLAGVVLPLLPERKATKGSPQ